jgi:hypothetical protein
MESIGLTVGVGLLDGVWLMGSRLGHSLGGPRAAGQQHGPEDAPFVIPTWRMVMVVVVMVL